MSTYAPPTVYDCGHAPTVTTGIGTGYARDAQTDATMCYACADSAQAADITRAMPGDRLTFYVSSNGAHITSWTGGILMRVAWRGALHHWSRERYYLRAVDASGRVWSGTGAEGMWTTLRLTREVQ